MNMLLPSAVYNKGYFDGKREGRRNKSPNKKKKKDKDRKRDRKHSPDKTLNKKGAGTLKYNETVDKEVKTDQKEKRHTIVADEVEMSALKPLEPVSEMASDMKPR